MGMMLSMPVLSGCMVGSIIYLWSQLNRDQTVTFYFGIQFKVRQSV